MNKITTALLSAFAACAVVSAHAGDQPTPNPANTTATTESSGGTLTKAEARDLKVQSKGEYKARKKVADANKDLNKANCEVGADGMLEHACKKDARLTAKQEKAEAQVIHEAEKADIKAKTAK